MYFLSVVLIGTTYPIFLEVITNEKISVGPPFYHKLIIPFLFPFLIFMAIGPNINWIKENYKKIKIQQIVFFVISILISYFIVINSVVENLFFTVLIIGALYLFFNTLKDFFKKKYNISQRISHFGFSLFILSILFNSLFSSEFSVNMKIGDKLKINNIEINLKNVETIDKKNYKSIVANFEIVNSKTEKVFLNPEIRIYNQPNILTSEADIKSTIFSDKFLVINLIKGEEYFNVRYQVKPFMIWIWLSILILIFGGFISLIKK
jgi:cytochrome c-type biogenesis protein CcmF